MGRLDAQRDDGYGFMRPFFGCITEGAETFVPDLPAFYNNGKAAVFEFYAKTLDMDDILELPELQDLSGVNEGPVDAAQLYIRDTVATELAMIGIHDWPTADELRRQHHLAAA
jgi:hypothetical protein